MPTTRKRKSRFSLVSITPDLVRDFAKWRELDRRLGSAKTPEGYLLSEDELIEYECLGRQVESGAINGKRKPWDDSRICYSMWGKAEHPASHNFSEFVTGGVWSKEWEQAVDIRQKLEADADKLETNLCQA